MAKKKAAGKKKPPTKTQVIANIAEKTELSKKEVAAVFDALEDEISRSLKSADAFTLPNGLLKIVKKHVKAQPAREVRNPRTGEMMMAKPKPARTTVRARPLKKLKEMV